MPPQNRNATPAVRGARAFLDELRSCSDCGHDKPLSEFKEFKTKGRSYRLRFCMDCWRVRYPDKRSALEQRANQLQTKFRMTLEQYDDLLRAQGGGCAVCGGQSPGGIALAVDHDHTCCPGRRSCGACVRGLLCTNCNKLIGHGKEDPSMMRKAASYVEDFRAVR